MVIKGAPKVKPVLPVATPITKPASPQPETKRERKNRKPHPNKNLDIVEVSTETVDPKEGI